MLYSDIPPATNDDAVSGEHNAFITPNLSWVEESVEVWKELQHSDPLESWNAVLRWNFVDAPIEIRDTAVPSSAEEVFDFHRLRHVSRDWTVASRGP